MVQPSVHCMCHMPGIEGPFVSTGATDFTLSTPRTVSGILLHVDVMPDFARQTPDVPTDRLFQVGWCAMCVDLTALGWGEACEAPRFIAQDTEIMSAVYPPGGLVDTLRTSVRDGGQVTFYVSWL